MILFLQIQILKYKLLCSSTYTVIFLLLLYYTSLTSFIQWFVNLKLFTRPEGQTAFSEKFQRLISEWKMTTWMYSSFNNND